MLLAVAAPVLLIDPSEDQLFHGCRTRCPLEKRRRNNSRKKRVYILVRRWMKYERRINRKWTRTSPSNGLFSCFFVVVWITLPSLLFCGVFGKWSKIKISVYSHDTLQYKSGDYEKNDAHFKIKLRGYIQHFSSPSNSRLLWHCFVRENRS